MDSGTMGLPRIVVNPSLTAISNTVNASQRARVETDGGSRARLECGPNPFLTTDNTMTSAPQTRAEARVPMMAIVGAE